MSDLEHEIEQIEASGILGRSSVYARLLQYLLTTSAGSSLPKEADIATDVFSRPDFDPSNDSSVRVYVHNLRQKLDAYYANLKPPAQRRLIIPKGEYRLRFSEVESSEVPKFAASGGRGSPWRIAAMGSMFLALAAVFWSGLTRLDSTSDVAGFRDTELWGPLLYDEQQIFVVVGDYFMLAETDESGLPQRLVRDFQINDSDDFEEAARYSPELRDRYLDINLTYLPVGTGPALGDVLKVLHSSDKPVIIVPLSRFRTSLIRAGHIVYVGYLSGLGSLSSYAFSASRLALGMSYDELVDTETGNTFRSDAGWITDKGSDYTDYGWISAIAGPDDNRFVVVAGTRDEALMHVASAAANLNEVRSIENALPKADSGGNRSFEVLYKVSSRDRTHIASSRVFVSEIDDSNVWTEHPE
jgi:hypothetical protein